MTSGEVAYVAYQEIRLSFAGPISVPLTVGLALMKMSPAWTPALIWLATSLSPAVKPVKVCPVAFWKAGPTTCCIRPTMDPAYRTLTGPELSDLLEEPQPAVSAAARKAAVATLADRGVRFSDEKMG